MGSLIEEIIQKLRSHDLLKYQWGIAGFVRSIFFILRKVKLDKDKRLKTAIIYIKAKDPDYVYRRVRASLPGVNHNKSNV